MNAILTTFPRLKRSLLLAIFLLLPLIIVAQDNEAAAPTTGSYVLWGVLIFFLVILPLSSIHSYRKTGIPRYRIMALLSLMPTVLFGGYACFMAEPPDLYYYIAAVLTALALMAFLVFERKEEE